MALVAKPVIDKQFWILQEDNRKVGNVEACAGGYQVKINNQIAQFKTIKMAARQINIDFEPAFKVKKSKITLDHVHGYPVAGRVIRWRTWRSPECGLANLEWQRQLRWKEDEVGKDFKGLGELTPQAVKAQEILDLYMWWTVTYRNRPDPYEASGWTAACEAQRLANGGKMSFSTPKDPVLKKAQDKAHKLLQKIEADYEKEDEAMMIRLIKVRHGLWT